MTEDEIKAYASRIVASAIAGPLMLGLVVGGMWCFVLCLLGISLGELP